MGRMSKGLRLLALALLAPSCDGNLNEGDVILAFTDRVSRSSAGAEGNARSERPSVSADGRYVAFVSGASNLVAGDANGADDVFRRDTLTGATVLVSVSLTGTSGNGASGAPSISADGRFVAFQSVASDLVPGDTAVQDVFVRDLDLGATVLVSADSAGGTADGPSFDPAVSGNGQFVAFTSSATDLVGGDANLMDDVFRRALPAGPTIRVSVDSAGAEATGTSFLDILGEPPGSGRASISADGTVIAFESGANNLDPSDSGFYRDVFVRDLNPPGPATVRASVEAPGDPDGFPLDFDNPDGNSIRPSVSADGRFVAFASFAFDLVTADANGPTDDIFVRDRNAGTTVLASVNPAGVQATVGCREPSISGDGRFVAFTSMDANLVADDTNQADDVFLRDRVAGAIVRVSVRTFGLQTAPLSSASSQPSLSADGRFVAFTSAATNLVDADANGVLDVFVRGPLR